MRRRLTLAIVGLVAATLVLAGLVTLVFARVDGRRQTREHLAERVVDIADAVDELPDGREVAILTRLRSAFDLADVSVARFREGATADPLPEGLDPADLDLALIASGATQTGITGNRAFAAHAVADRITPAVLPVAIVVDAVEPGIGVAGRWFLVAGAVTLLIGSAVAAATARAVAVPLLAAEQATRRIAAGDLSARVPEAPATGQPDELARMVHSINEMAEQLERSRGAERQFLLSISHDLRTPLTSIRGWAEAIADGATPEPAAAAAVVLKEAQRLDRLVRDLLDLAKLETRGFRFDLADIDLADVAAGTAEGLRPELEDLGLSVDVVGTGPAIVRADPDRLAQLAANLLENAGKHARSMVRVVIGTKDGWAWLAVDDDGPGIAEQDLPHVFVRLYVSSHQPARQESGSGLGLAIVRELAAAMGGTVGAGHAPTGGARLVVHLPLVTR